MPTGIVLGPIVIHYYGIIIMTGVLLASWLASLEAKRRGFDPDLIWDMLPWLLIAGIAGARLWHIMTPTALNISQGITFSYYLTHPLDALAVWRGGLGIPGAVAGGAIALLIYCRNKKISFLTFADIIVPGLALAQAVGRWGNFVNQELYGAPSNLPWAIAIDPAYRISGYETVTHYHPLFLYESLWNLLVMALLLWGGRRFQSQLKTGDIFLTYMVFYPVGRFLLEFLRLDPSPVAGININQTLMAVVCLCAIVALVIRHRREPEEIAN